MKIDTRSLVSISEANQNFSRVARLVDENGIAVILKNNVPRYVITEYNELQSEQLNPDDEVQDIAERLIAKHRAAFEELAK